MPRNKKALTKKKGKSKNRIDKGKGQNGNEKVFDLNTILSQADVAMETSNVETALQLYQHVSSNLQLEIESNLSLSGNYSGNAETENKMSDVKSISPDVIDKVFLLSKVMSKMGEARVSTGDQEGGRNDFLAAIQALNSISSVIEKHNIDGNNMANNASADTTTDDDVNMDNTLETTSENMISTQPTSLKAQWMESRACIRLFIGQLSCAEEALECIQGAIEDLKDCVTLLQSEVDQNHTSMTSDTKTALITTLSDTKHQLCGAYCSAAELYLTDLCYETNAEKECESFLQNALRVNIQTQEKDCINYENVPDEAFVDALQGMANLRLSQNRGLDAIEYIIKTYDKIKEGCEAMADLVGLGRSNATKGKDLINNKDLKKTDEPKEIQEKAYTAIQSLPDFGFRCQTAKLLLECASSVKMDENDEDDTAGIKKSSFLIEASIQVLGSLLAENDEVVEIWYLLGCAFSSLVPPNKDVSRYYWNTALEMLNKVKNEWVHNNDSSGDQSEIEDVEGKIDEIQQRLTELNTMEPRPMDLDD